jgi:hypothetical protein
VINCTLTGKGKLREGCSIWESVKQCITCHDTDSCQLLTVTWCMSGDTTLNSSLYSEEVGLQAVAYQAIMTVPVSAFVGSDWHRWQQLHIWSSVSSYIHSTINAVNTQTPRPLFGLCTVWCLMHSHTCY